MTDDMRIRELLEEILDSHCTPEDACAESPELLPKVRARLERLQRVEDQIEVLFPSSNPAAPGNLSRRSRTPDPKLPQIDGYDVEAILGYGGMGVVYRARHLKLDRTVALKMLLAGAWASQHELARFLREAQAIAGLQHSHIVQVHDAGELEGRPYFTMEYVEGGSLAQELAGAPQPARRAAELVSTLAGAVELAHNKGIIHRDLKPANILIASDGTPKIADFGVARHVDCGPELTLSGARVGTPSYMAPEQALGKVDAIGTSVDIYALGAILYEMLTGRPPFRADTASETERQVIAEEPAPPSRLSANVPRDVETICLKCLSKDPARRYARAADLADDLQRFLNGQPILARPVGPAERAVKWAQRHPAVSLTISGGILLTVALFAGGWWLMAERSAMAAGVEDDLRVAGRAQQQSSWSVARAAVERARARLGTRGADYLHRRVDQCGRELDLVERLENIRLKRVTRGELAFYKAQSGRDYEAVFRAAGIGKFHDEPLSVAEMINASGVRGALVAALEDWSNCASDRDQRAWLLDVARRAEPDPEGWRQRVLDPVVWEDSKALAELVPTVPVAKLPALLLLALGERLRNVGGDATPFLKQVQQEYPADFWANLIVGNSVLQNAPAEASGYYRAALSSRPEAAVGYCAVGDALRLQKQPGEATRYYEKALVLDPGYARAHSNLGLVLQVQDRLPEAIDCYQKALQFDPDYAWAHHNLGNALQVVGRLDEAYEQYQHVLRLDPGNVEVQEGLRSVLLRLGRWQEARVGWRKMLDADPRKHEAWFGYGELCVFLREEEEYRQVRRTLLDQFGAGTDPHLAEKVGRACLLVPVEGGDLAEAAALIDRAVAAKGSIPDWIYRYFLFAMGLAEYRQGRLDSAISVMKGEASRVMGPAPRLILAMAQYRQGESDEARKSLATAIIGFDWTAPQADSRDVWISHILRREAQAMILPNLPALPPEEYQPEDNAERIALLANCQFQGLNAAAARFYADAFMADPGLADELTRECLNRVARGDEQPTGRLEDLNTECLYPAARSAALAGCGLGADASQLSEADRTRWRNQARVWLAADLAMWTKALDSGSRATRVRANKMLTQWRADPDLAGLREPSALEKLSADERDEWLALWNAVDGLLSGTTGP